MACRFTGIVVGSRGAEALATSWSAVLDHREPGREEGAIGIGPAEGSGGPAPTLAPAARLNTIFG